MRIKIKLMRAVRQLTDKAIDLSFGFMTTGCLLLGVFYMTAAILADKLEVEKTRAIFKAIETATESYLLGSAILGAFVLVLLFTHDTLKGNDD